MSEGHQAPSALLAATLLARSTQPLDTLAALEGYPQALSGVTTSLLSALLTQHAPTQVVADRYAYALLDPMQQQLLAGYGLTLLDSSDLEAVGQASTPGTLLYTTSLQEPYQTVPDLQALGELARACHATLLIDSTQTPLLSALPAQASALHRHSTLLLGQRSDLGCLFSSQAPLSQPVVPASWGHLSSLPARLRLHSAHAQAVADVLAGHPQVRAVYYPGLGTHPQFERAAETFPDGFGGRVSLEVRQPHFGERLGHCWRQQAGFGTVYSTFERHHPSGVWQLWLGLEDIVELLGELEAALE